MQLVFRIISQADVDHPAAGEFYLWHHAEHHKRRLAQWVYEHGLADLPRGEGEARCLVVQHDPTLDDMLAASFIERLLAGEKLPAEADSFARYAGDAREGLLPGCGALETSLTSVYQAIRSEAGMDMREPETADRFRDRWRRLEAHVFQAMQSSRSPFDEASLFERDGPFSRELAFLAKDAEVYRQDVGRGETWRARIPGAARTASALLLRDPKSLLFKHWCRIDQRSPTRDGFLLLGVDWGHGEWIFSTDRVQRISLKSLHERLQATEAALAPRAAERDPWFDGAPFEHTLVAAPKSGTVIPEKRLLRIVKHWSRRPPLSDRESRYQAAAVACAGVAALALVLLLWRPAPRPFSHSVQVVSAAVNGDQELARGVTALDDYLGGGGAELEVVLQPDTTTTVMFEAKKHYQVPWAVRLRTSCQATGNLQPSLVGLRLNRVELLPQGETSPSAIEVPCELEPDVNMIQVRAHNSHSRELRAKLRVEWLPDPARPATLHLLAVGVSNYQTHSDLNYADDDARELGAFFRNDRSVYGGDPNLNVLIDPHATAEEILKRLAAIREMAKPTDLFVFALSGHGARDFDGHFYFLPYEYDPEETSLHKAISWNELERQVAKVRCKVLLILDCCHSGQATREMQRLAAGSDLSENSGRFVMAASLAKDLGLERHDWKNGALTLAILEALTGQHRFDVPGLTDYVLPKDHPHARDQDSLTLHHLQEYVPQRVLQLTAGRQKVVTNSSGNMSLLDIPITAMKR